MTTGRQCGSIDFVMEEILLIAFLCMLAGSGYFLVTWPVLTLATLSGATFIGFRWWKRRQHHLLLHERHEKIRRKLLDYPKLQENYQSLPVKSLFDSLEKAIEASDEYTRPYLLEMNETLESQRERLQREAGDMEEKLTRFLYQNPYVLESEVSDAQRSEKEAATKEERNRASERLKRAQAKLDGFRQEEESMAQWYEHLKKLEERIKNLSQAESALESIESKSLSPAESLIEEIRKL